MYTELIQVYSRIPGVIVSKLVYAVTFWLNSFPAKDGISDTLMPRAMITGQSVEFTKHRLLDFGEYIHTHEDEDNSMQSRTLEALALLPTGNSQNSHCLFNLYTVLVIT